VNPTLKKANLPSLAAFERFKGFPWGRLFFWTVFEIWPGEELSVVTPSLADALLLYDFLPCQNLLL